MHERKSAFVVTEIHIPDNDVSVCMDVNFAYLVGNILCANSRDNAGVFAFGKYLQSAVGVVRGERVLVSSDTEIVRADDVEDDDCVGVEDADEGEEGGV